MQTLPSGSPPARFRNPDGSTVFKLENFEVPQSWSQVASDVLAQKYFRKAGVPAALKKVEGERRPRPSCWRSVARREGARQAAGRRSATGRKPPQSKVF